MKKLIVIALVAAGVALWVTGCGTDMTVGGGTKTVQQSPTLGQQLVDLQKAKDSGALTDAEFQAQKAKLLAQ